MFKVGQVRKEVQIAGGWVITVMILVDSVPVTILFNVKLCSVYLYHVCFQ